MTCLIFRANMTSQERESNVMNKEELQELVSDLQKQLQEAQDKLENFAKNARFKPKRQKIISM